MKAVQGCSMKDGGATGATGATGPYLCVSSPFPVCASKESDQLKEFWSSSRAQLLRCTAALLVSFFSLVIHSSCPCRWPLLSPQGHRRSSAEFIHKYKEITCTEDIVRCTHPRITGVYSLMGVTADQVIVCFFFLKHIYEKHGVVHECVSYLRYCMSGNNLLTPLFPILLLFHLVCLIVCNSYQVSLRPTSVASNGIVGRPSVCC